MGITSQLIPALVCLLACTSNFIHGSKSNIPLEETIKTLTILTQTEDPQCMKLAVTDVLTSPKNTTEKETFCRAADVVRQVYTNHENHKCVTKRSLRKLDKNLSSMAEMTTCPVDEAKTSTLKEFLGTLKTIMQEKYNKIP